MKIFIINLEDSPERKDFMQQQFESLDFDKKDFEIVFFRAINAKKNEHFAFKQYSKTKAIFCRGKEMSGGERACFASHYSLWQKCLELNEPIAVLEDDVRLKGDFFARLGEILASPYCYVKFNYLKNHEKLFPLQNDFYIAFAILNLTQG